MKLRTLVLTGLAALLVMAPTSVFADDTQKEEKLPGEVRLEQVAEYTPENLAEWERLIESKDQIKSEREVLKAELKDLIENVWKPMMADLKAETKAIIQAFADDLKLQVENEELTKEEATVLLQTFKDNYKVDHEANKAAREALKAERQEDKLYYDNLRAEKKVLNENIKLAIENEETDLIPGYLNAILVINQELEAHAIEVNNAIQDKINEINQ